MNYLKEKTSQLWEKKNDFKKKNPKIQEKYTHKKIPTSNNLRKKLSIVVKNRV